LIGAVIDWFLWQYWKLNKPFLAALAETLIGKTEGPLKPDGKEIVARCEKFLDEAPRQVFRQAMLALRLLPMSYSVRLSHSFLKRLWAKILAVVWNHPARIAFVRASPEKRTEKVAGWMERLREQAAEAEDDFVKNIVLLNAIRGLLQGAYLELPETWEGLGYDPFPAREWSPPSGPEIRNPPPTRNSTYLLENAKTLRGIAPRNGDRRVDYCVIGSGAGGATVAYGIQREHPEARILLLESGPLVPNHKLPLNVMDSLTRIYMNGGTTLSKNQKFTFRQGHCVGGSTLVNNSVALKPEGFWWDTNIVERWSFMGVKLDWAELHAAFDTIGALLNVQPIDPRVITPQAETLKAGFEALGQHRITPVRANLRNCIGCGRCNVGCPYDAKQSMAHTTIPRFMEAGGELVPDAHVKKIRFSGPIGARRVESVCVAGNGFKTDIKADKFVLASGAYASSKLLWRSKFLGCEPGVRTVGKQFSGNFGAGVFGRFREPQNGWSGQQIGYVVEVPEERMVIETAFAPPPALGWMAPQWGDRFMDVVKSCDYIAAAVPVFGTLAYGDMHSKGLPGQFKSGFAIDFDLIPEDYRRLAVGMELTARAMFEAGAEEVFTTRFDARSLQPGENVDDYFNETGPLQYLKLETAHMQGGNVIHRNPDQGVVDASLKVHGVGNLWITDASVIPAPITLNIQLMVMALAAYAAPRIVAAPVQ
jgi:choline dehydrogenase-like flavoprotein